MKTRIAFPIVASAVLKLLGATTHYVALDSDNPTPPYTNWATAAHVIQEAVDAAAVGDTVLVTNGVYSIGQRDVSFTGLGGLGVGRLGATRVVITNTIRLESLNGPSATAIDGGGEVRCVYAVVNAVIAGFRLSRGAASFGEGGGGVYGGLLTNCILRGNVAVRTEGMWQGYGGGAYLSVLYNCTLAGNAAAAGGGAARCTLNNCLLTENAARVGGGTWTSTLTSCTLACNTAADEGGGGGLGTLYNCIVYDNMPENGVADYYYCCTSPVPTNGVGNISRPPHFRDAAAGDFRLSEDSPCIDAGTNLLGFSVSVWAAGGLVVVGQLGGTDLYGLSRFLDGNGDGTVGWDMGAYEYNPYRFTPDSRLTPAGMAFTIRGEPGKTVRLERSHNLEVWEEMAVVPIPANGQSLIDPQAIKEQSLFYRGVALP